MKSITSFLLFFQIFAASAQIPDTNILNLRGLEWNFSNNRKYYVIGRDTVRIQTLEILWNDTINDWPATFVSTNGTTLHLPEKTRHCILKLPSKVQPYTTIDTTLFRTFLEDEMTSFLDVAPFDKKLVNGPIELRKPYKSLQNGTIAYHNTWEITYFDSLFLILQNEVYCKHYPYGIPNLDWEALSEREFDSLTRASYLEPKITFKTFVPSSMEEINLIKELTRFNGKWKLNRYIKHKLREHSKELNEKYDFKTWYNLFPIQYTLGTEGLQAHVFMIEKIWMFGEIDKSLQYFVYEFGKSNIDFLLTVIDERYQHLLSRSKI